MITDGAERWCFVLVDEAIPPGARASPTDEKHGLIVREKKIVTLIRAWVTGDSEWHSWRCAGVTTPASFAQSSARVNASTPRRAFARHTIYSGFGAADRLIVRQSQLIYEIGPTRRRACSSPNNDYIYRRGRIKERRSG